MSQKTVKLLFALLRSAICGNQLSEQERNLYSSEMLPALIAISKRHDIAHLLAEGLNINGLLAKENSDVGNEIIKAIYRHAQLGYEYVIVCDALEAAQIPFIPLKGSVLRQWYPEPWMRTSCDIDILVHREHLEQAVSYLIETLEYTEHRRDTHDVSLFSKSGQHIELHFDLVEEGRAGDAIAILKDVWKNVLVKKEKLYWYEMSDEYFYFYHIAHMAKHIEIGGCGIRPFIDLWILEHINDANKCKRDKLLEKGKLLKFAMTARRLSNYWIESALPDEATLKMESFILSGGVYGTLENRIAVQQQKKGGRAKYALSKIFIPYDIIKFHYPILQKHRWLLPIMEVRRWFKLVFCGHVKRSIRELKLNKKISHIEAEQVKEFLNDIGL